jgi:hypothetical protein
VHEECTGTRKVVHPSVHQPNYIFDKILMSN